MMYPCNVRIAQRHGYYRAENEAQHAALVLDEKLNTQIPECCSVVALYCGDLIATLPMTRETDVPGDELQAKFDFALPAPFERYRLDDVIPGEYHWVLHYSRPT